MAQKAPPRIYCLPATKAPVVAVFRRGPTTWSHVGRWDLVKHRYEPGAWLGGRIFPRRSDLSPDGRYLCYFAHQTSATWEHGDAYVAVSKLPWLTALHAFGTCGTWTRGYYFSGEKSPDSSEDLHLPIPYQLCAIPVVQFANERRRGWEEAPDSPPRDPKDIWDDRRNARMRKPQPGGHQVLCVESLGWAGGEFESGVDGLQVRYSLEDKNHLEFLDDFQWADWDHQGRLLVATRSGRLQIWELGTKGQTLVFDENLSTLKPDLQPSPVWAQKW